MRFKDKVVIITGAASGIGRAAALAFIREGAAVVIVDIDQPASEEVVSEIAAQGGKAFHSKTDLSVEHQVKNMVTETLARYGRIDVLVNNAGIYFQADVTGTPFEVWEQVLRINLTGAFLCTKYAVQAMVVNRSGVIINVASEAGLVGIKGQVSYNVSKGGLIQLTRSCAVDLADRGIRVNCVCPGTTETPLVKLAVSQAPDPQAARQALESIRPLNRLGTPEEIAAAILFLASDEVAFATGAILSVDGGFTTQ
jgi:NAD(P)-dependent dehydrogenase (short-subunit alcohol dehydrogenase family)